MMCFSDRAFSSSSGSSSICVHVPVWHSDEAFPLIIHEEHDAMTPGPGIQALEAEKLGLSRIPCGLGCQWERAGSEQFHSRAAIRSNGNRRH
jgi:hypothetical protein